MSGRRIGGNIASNQAAEYAEKKRQQMERAQQLKEERKANIMRVAQHDIVGGSSNGFSNQSYSGASNSGGGYPMEGYNGGGFSGSKGQYNGGMQQLGGPRNNGSQSSGIENIGGYGRGGARQSHTNFNQDFSNGSGIDLGGYNPSQIGAGGPKGYGTGELRSFGYQPPSSNSKSQHNAGHSAVGRTGPVRAVDFGYDQQNTVGGGYSNSNIKGGYNGGGQSSGFGKYDDPFGGSKESTAYTNSNYRKPFNPNNMQTPSNMGSTSQSSYQMNAGGYPGGSNSNYRNSSITQGGPPSYNKPPSGQGQRSNTHNQMASGSRRPINDVDNQRVGPSSNINGGYSQNNSRDIPQKKDQYSNQYNKPPSSRGNKPSYNSRDQYEEQKYMPQKREAPARSMGNHGNNSNSYNNGGGSGGYSQQNYNNNQYNNKQSSNTRGGNQGYGNQQQQKNNGGGYRPSAPTYENEIDQQVIPALKKQGGGGFGADAFVKQSEMDLNRCPDCDRKFNDEAYEKHVRICNKVFQQKRKEFNSQQHRILNNEHKQILMQAKRKGDDPAPGKGKPGMATNPPRRAADDMPVKGGKGGLPKWKLQSEMFRQAMRAANGGGGGGNSYGGKGGAGGKGGYQAPQEYDDRVQCPHCGRKFAELACQRHMPHCEQSMKKQQMRNPAPNRRR